MNALPALYRSFSWKQLFCASLVIAFLLPGCRPNGQKHFVIGFSQCVESDLWRKTMLEEMKREMSFHDNVSLVYKQADGNSQKQIEQVKELVKSGIDILVISPNEAEPLTPIVEETLSKGMPVIVVDRKIASSMYTAFIGADNYEVGRLAGEYATSLLKGKERANIIEITGLPKSTPAIGRNTGFNDAIRKHPYFHIIDTLNGQWYKQTAKEELLKIAGTLKNVDLVYAHNDMMAYSAYEVFTQAGLPQPLIIGVDGLAGKNAGMQFVAEKKITATMLYPTTGQEAISTAVRILSNESYQKENLLQTTVIDSTNVQLMQLQADKIGSQQQQIERQQTWLDEQRRIYKDQQTYLYILISSLVLAVGLGGLAMYSLNMNRRKNQVLRLQNEEISSQKNQIEEMSEKAQTANEAKVAFFTNISHEFRTPLTLILGPLEELMAGPNISYTTSQRYSLIHKNVIRLLRLMNQLIDFRKVELEKMKLRASEADLIHFTAEILESYKSIALKRKIDLRLITNERRLEVWFEGNMLDKVIFNLLSNAFKFTKDNGFVHVYIHKSEDGKQAVLKVEDNGVGMKPESLRHAFEVFYQGEHENYKGSGLGLSLSKELIQLHKGSISVSSEKWKGTAFEIRLPLGKAHLSKTEMADGEEEQTVLYEQEKVYTADLLPEMDNPKEPEGIVPSKEYSMLVIEDNADLRQFLKTTFRDKYEILEADNGQSALQQAFDNVPDIIICDVVIPGKDGITMVNIFKTDVRTSHIPVILLTAKSGIDQQIEGMKNRADVYMTKPFNIRFLRETVESLLSNRARLKAHFTGDISSNLKTQTLGKLDRKFISEFTAYIESNIANEELNIEEICKSMGISRVQLYRKVKALMNMNVNDYILNTRLQKAKYLLQHEEQSISEIAYKVGFSSPAYFSTVFKSKFGMTPKAFKEK